MADSLSKFHIVGARRIPSFIASILGACVPELDLTRHGRLCCTRS